MLFDGLYRSEGHRTRARYFSETLPWRLTTVRWGGGAPTTVLLFYRDFERDTYFKNDRYLKRVVKPIYDRFRSGPKVSGFLVWFRLLVKALRSAGCDVRIDDYAFARRHPDYPVGLTGYPAMLDGWSLPNPAILGPGLYDHPLIAPRLMDDPRFRGYVATCQWGHDMFAQHYGEDCLVDWHAGIDLAEWPDGASHDKNIDVLIYDKVRWNRDRYEPELIAPIGRYLEGERGLTVRTVRYGAYDHAEYRELLQSARSLLFLCESETQGMAYQEALASNVPVLAWVNGFWLDPNRAKWEANPVPATSVPYFDETCGRQFRDIAGFRPAFDDFWASLGEFAPRGYVARNLSFAGSAESYLQAYRRLLPVGRAASRIAREKRT